MAEMNQRNCALTTWPAARYRVAIATHAIGVHTDAARS